MQNIANDKSKEESVQPFKQSLADAQALVQDIKKILAKSEPAMAHEEKIKTEMETLGEWIKSYHQGISAADKISTAGGNLVNDIRDRLKLAIEEMQRLEGEGGMAANKADQAEVEELIKALRRLEKVIPVIQETFGCEALQPKDENTLTKPSTN